MSLRSLVLFAHVVGVIVLFIALAFESLTFRSHRRSATADAAAPWAMLSAVLPRLYGAAFALVFIPGIYLARRISAFDLPWVWLSLSLMVVMGIIGNPAVRSRVPHAWLRASLVMRTAMGLAAVYLMIGKPDLTISLLVIGGGVAVGVVISLISPLQRVGTLNKESA